MNAMDALEDEVLHLVAPGVDGVADAGRRVRAGVAEAPWPMVGAYAHTHVSERQASCAS